MVCGAILRLGLSNNKPTANMQSRAIAVQKATGEMSRFFDRRQVQDSLHSKNGPKLYQIFTRHLLAVMFWYIDLRMIDLKAQALFWTCGDKHVLFFAPADLQSFGLQW